MESGEDRRSAWRVASLALIAVVLATTLAGCLAPAGDTSKVVKISAANVDGWHYDYFENRAYPCSISGYQTFAIGTKIGSSPTDSRPLWVKLRGGGKGYFDEDGTPQPSAENKTEITLAELLTFDTPGLMAKVKAASEGFRVLLVSMCSHDVYGGTNTPDPHNPNTTPDGKLRPTTGLIATKAAIQYAGGAYPTSDSFLHGTSAGGAGVLHVGWALQLQGIAPAGVVSDAGIVDQVRTDEIPPQCVDEDSDGGARDAVAARVDPALADPNNLPDRLVARGELTVPILQVWNDGDPLSCGSTPMTCVLADGSSVTLGATDCHHENMRRAIVATAPTTGSVNLPVCVTPEGADPCAQHVVTTREGAVNTDPSTPRNYQAFIMAWVRVRLGDPPAG